MANEWQDRPYPRSGFTSNDQYIVPVDKVPTDEEAKSRPEVMVLDCQTELWESARLIAVIADSPARLPFIAQLPECWVREYRDCRFPYPGERVDGRSLRLGE